MKSLGKIIVATGCLAVALLLWLIWREHDRLSAARERLDAAARNLLTLRKESIQQQKALTKPGLAVERRAATQSTSPTSTVSAPAAPTTSPAPKRAASRPWLTRLFVESPNLHRLYLEAYRSDLEFTHALSFTRMGLTAEERAAMLTLIARDMERRSDIAVAARGAELGSTDASILELFAQCEREHEAALRQLLGERRVTWSPNARPSMVIASDAVAQLHRTSTPLTLAQAEELAAMARKGLSGRRVDSIYVPPSEADHEILKREAEQILLPGQREVVRALIDQQLSRRKLDDARRELERAQATKRK